MQLPSGFKTTVNFRELAPLHDISNDNERIIENLNEAINGDYTSVHKDQIQNNDILNISQSNDNSKNDVENLDNRLHLDNVNKNTSNDMPSECESSNVLRRSGRPKKSPVWMKDYDL